MHLRDVQSVALSLLRQPLYVVEAWILDIMLKCWALKTAVLRANVLIHILLQHSDCTFVLSYTVFHPRRKQYIPEREPVIPFKKTKTLCVDQLMFYVEGSEVNVNIL